MAPRLSGQTSLFGVFFVSKSLLGIEKQRILTHGTSPISVIHAWEAREPHTPLSPFSFAVSRLAPDLSFEY